MISLQQRILKKLIVLVLVCFFITSIYAKVVTIQVGGGGPENLKFVPQNVTANKGDFIHWEFMGGNHNVVESDGVGSCNMKDEPSFESLTNPPTANYTIEIKSDVKIITYMCSFGSHCSGGGMWGIIFVEPASVEPTSTNKANNNDNNNDNNNNATNAPPVDEKNNSGKIAGIVIGSVSSFAIVSIIGFLLAKRCRSKQRTVPILEGIKKVENTDQATKDINQAKLENV